MPTTTAAALKAAAAKPNHVKYGECGLRFAGDPRTQFGREVPKRFCPEPFGHFYGREMASDRVILRPPLSEA